MKEKLVISAVTFCLILNFGSLFAQSPAKLIVYRKGSPYGLLATYKVNLDNNEVATLKGRSSYETTLTPGSHTISPKQSKRALTLNAESGKTYFVKYRTMPGIFGARPKLKEMSMEDAKSDAQFISKKY